MGKVCAVVVLVRSAAIFLPAKAVAQGGEVFGGYSYLRGSSGSGYNSGGWEGSLTGNFNRFFGLEADLSDHYNSAPGDVPYSSGFSFLFGPHFAYRNARTVNPFVHALVGGTRGSHGVLTVPACPTSGCPVFGPLHQTAFTAGFGGGIDLKASRFLWIRVVQVDYLHESLSSDPQNDDRLSFGVVLRFAR
jgi:hypothetical protein